MLTDATIFWIYTLLALLVVITGMMAALTFWDLVMDRQGSGLLYGLLGAWLGFFSFFGVYWIAGAVV